MKNITIKAQIVLLLLLFIKTNSAQTWEKINPFFPLNDTLGNFASIAFTNKDTGWLYTALQVIKPYGDVIKKLYRTIDEGKSWEKKISDTGAYDIYKIQARNPDFLFILYHVNKILITTNGVYSWDSSEINENLQSSIRQIHFFNDKDAIAFNDYRWFTSDGGYNWKKGGDTITIFPQPTDVFFVNESLGWLVSNISDVTDVGSIAITTNGGRNWQYQHKRAPLLYGVYFIDSLKGFAVGANRFSGTAYICKTYIGGINWDANPFGSGPFWCIEFLDSLNGWISGSGKILRTNDGGETWEVNIDGLNTNFEQLIILKKEKVAYAFGKDWNGYTYTLLRADLSNITSVMDEKNNFPEQFLLLYNYPNPFNTVTTISYQIKEQGLVQLKVFNLLGQELATLVNEFKPEGKYSVIFDASVFGGLSSGVYVYTLRVNEFIQNRKMTLLK